MTRLTLRLGSTSIRSLALLTVAVALVMSLATSAHAAGAWTAIGAMVYGPRSHAAALLADGRVLVAGGYTVLESGVTSCSLRDTQAFDPTAGTWTATGSMATARQLHTATTLNDGRVVVAGGVDCGFYISRFHATAEVFNPVTGTWAAVGSMTAGRYRHTATLLRDGRVLVVGGSGETAGVGSTAEIFDPASGTWSATQRPLVARAGHTATLLSDGRVLVAGGFGSGGGLSSAEIFDQATGTWSAAGSLRTGRFEHTATLLNDGRVLVAGGRAEGGGNFVPLVDAEIFDPATDTWSATGSLRTARSRHTSTLLGDGRVLVAGGFVGTGSLSSAEIFDPVARGWTESGSMLDARSQHTATRLADGRVLTAGGEGDGACCAEVFAPAPGGGTPTPTPTPAPSASITVSAPNGSEAWPIGSTQTIRWTATGDSGNVRVELSRDGGASYKQIASNVPNTGAFEWTVSNPPTDRALIRVTSIDQSGVQDASDAAFRITR